MLTSRDIVAIIVFVCLLVGYITCSALGLTDSAQALKELLTIVTVAIVSYYLGYSVKQRNAVKNCSLPSNIAHLTTNYIKRLGYIAIGFGVALIIEHVVTSGVDLTPVTELLLGHEWIGLYCLIAGMVAVGLSKSMCKELREVRQRVR